jgi:putative Mn2+ efflux pump MntP
MNKKIIIGVIIAGLILSFLGGFILSQTLTEQREELYKQFGPKLLDAVVRVMASEINILRVKEGLPERTNEQILTAITNELNNIPDYNWMNEEI